eukprot:s105_g9.t1
MELQASSGARHRRGGDGTGNWSRSCIRIFEELTPLCPFASRRHFRDSCRSALCAVGSTINRGQQAVSPLGSFDESWKWEHGLVALHGQIYGIPAAVTAMDCASIPQWIRIDRRITQQVPQRCC